jgi:hypothetical protein
MQNLGGNMAGNVSNSGDNAAQAAEAARQAEVARQAAEAAAAAQATAAAAQQAAQQDQATTPAPQEPQRVASTPATDQQITAKKDQLATQQALVDKATARADATNNPELKAQATELAKTYDAREKATLAADVYHYGSETPTAAPVGWLRGSEHPELLSKVGLTNADLAPKESEFRAEVYFPDPRMGNTESKPVISYKGTTPNSAENWISNFTQGTGSPTAYYDRAMSVAMKVESKTDGNFEVTGHSLGGGMASAASAVTGAKTTTFNSAGLHPNTAKTYLAQFNREPVNTDNNVKAYQVDGDILTSVQEAASELTPKRADQVADILHKALPLANNPIARGIAEKNGQHIPDLSGLMSAQGSDLLGMREAVGEQIKMPAVNADGTPRPYMDPMGGANGIIAHADSAISAFERPIGQGGQIGAIPGNAIVGGSKVVGDTITGVGGNVAGTIRDGGALVNQKLDSAGRIANTAITDKTNAADQAISGAGRSANSSLDTTGRNINTSLDQTGNNVRSSLDSQGADVRKNMREFGERGGWFTGMLMDGAGAVAEFGHNATGYVTDKTLDVGGAVANKTLDVTGNVLQFGGNLTGKIVSGTGNVAGAVTDKTLDVAGNVAQTGTNITSNVVGIGSNVVGSATSIVGGAVGKPIAAVGEKTGQVVGIPIGILAARNAYMSDPILQRAGASAGEMVARHSSYQDSLNFVVKQQEAELRSALR